MTDENEIQELVKKAQGGDSESFGLIYDTYARQVHNFLFGKLRHQQVCEDMVHTVFLKAWTNLKSYQPRAGAKFFFAAKVFKTSFSFCLK